MIPPTPIQRITIFLVGLVAVFAVAAGIGSLVDRADTETDAAHETGAHGDEHGEMTAATPAGLSISEGGYSLRLMPASFTRSEERQLRFAISGSDGEAVEDFDELHERRMHLIVVRRDGTGFRHLHPEVDAAGTWTMPISFAAAGVYRVFADFSVEGEQHTLARDLFVSGGDFEARPFPVPVTLDSTSGYEVRLRAEELRAGEPSSLAFDVSMDGAAVSDLSPYLGAKGHLVALREGDLAFLHVHPETEGAANEIAFAATFPTPGRYRLYLQSRHRGAVRTAQFTVAVPR